MVYQPGTSPCSIYPGKERVVFQAGLLWLQLGLGIVNGSTDEQDGARGALEIQTQALSGGQIQNSIIHTHLILPAENSTESACRQH